MAVRNRRWGVGLAGGVAVHALAVLAILLTVKIASPLREPPAFSLELVPPWRPPSPPARASPPRPPAQAPSALQRAAPPVAAPKLASAPSAPAAASGTGDDAMTRVRAMLRGAVGCADPKVYRLTPDEQARCARRLQAQVDPDLRLEPPLDPAKRAWFDASLRARKAGQYMPLGVPRDHSIMWNVGGIGGKKGPHQLSIGPLHVGLPPGAFNDDDAPPP